MTTERREISINVPLLARVEGEGALDITIKDDEITDLKLRIFEPPRFFEKLLEQRPYHDLPDMVARICGICPVAYQMSAVLALEDLFSCDPGPWVDAMRRVFYCGEWIQSHSLHIHLLAAPDFLGYESAPQMARDYPEEVRRGLRLQAVGNNLITLLGARSVNPVGARAGGFHKAPAPEQVRAILQELQAALGDAEALLRWTAELPLPRQSQPFTCISLLEQERYPMMSRELITDSDERIPIDEFGARFREYQVPHSTALHCLYRDQPYLVGPLARVNLHRGKLHHDVLNVLDSLPVQFPSDNTFHSIVARAAEIYHAILIAIELLRDYRLPQQPYGDISPRAGNAYGCSEAPRGFLWHRYAIDEQGCIVNARIVPPTSQNQARIEEDIRLSLQQSGLHADDHVLRKRAEQVIRNYDPCISCATHFLDLTVTRI